MKFSIITPSYNRGDFIEETIQSVISQEFNGTLEYLIMDGESKDGTLELLRKYEDKITLISEKDEGYCFAINKGINLATGDVIGVLGSDDLYLPGSFQKVQKYFEENPETKWVYGKCKIINESGNIIWNWITRYKNIMSKKFSLRRLLTENYISEPAVFIKKEVFEEFGVFDHTLKFAMDYDLWLRIARKYPPGIITGYLASFRRHNSSKSEMNYKEQFREQYNVAKRHEPGGVLLVIHWLNNQKIIFSYWFLKKLGF
jgi:glycosyltransferase involved in cell wall biosynthesis